MSGYDTMGAFASHRKAGPLQMTDRRLQDCIICSMINRKLHINLRDFDISHNSSIRYLQSTLVFLFFFFGIGNIFRVFIGGIADGLLEEGALDRGLTCVETFDYDVADKIYAPYDNLGLSVILHGDGTRDYKVLGALAEAVKAQSSNDKQWNRLKEIFAAPSLQLVSFTITEKGYALQKADGTWFPFVEADIKNGPAKAT